MTKLENQAITLANEVEQYIKSGNLTNLVLALNEFKKVELESDITWGKDLDNMYAQFTSQFCPVINLASVRQNKNQPRK